MEVLGWGSEQEFSAGEQLWVELPLGVFVGMVTLPPAFLLPALANRGRKKTRGLNPSCLQG